MGAWPCCIFEPHAVHTLAIWQLNIYFVNKQFIWPCAVSKRLIKEWALRIYIYGIQKLTYKEFVVPPIVLALAIYAM
jgi:hypothetical protein